MFIEPIRSDPTIARYEIEASEFIDQYCRKHQADVCDAPDASRVVMAVLWYLNAHGRWSKSYVRGLAAALSQRLEMLVSMELVTDNPVREKSLLWRLKNDRPQPAERAKKTKQSKAKVHQRKVSATKARRKSSRKSLPVQELRALIAYFRNKADGFSLWILGYILIASRLGWRPGEIVTLRQEGNFLRADAEKNTNGRGLFATCEVDISAYPASIIGRIDQWIAETGKWEEKYGGLWAMPEAMNSRLARACGSIDIARVSTYTFRHFAIASMKKSGFTKSEIAVIVNHATDRTAGEKYGKGRSGIKRAKKMLRFQKSRLDLVRKKARAYPRKIEGPAEIPTPEPS